jgi:hypothetical protein
MFFLILSLVALDPRYHTYQRMMQEIDSLALLHTEIARVETVGVTAVNQLPIIAVKISDNPQMDEDEPALLFVGVHHAEEVLGCEVCIYTIEHLLEGYDNDSLTTRLVDNLELWFIPILNVDGHGIVTSGIDTTWRKNLRDNNDNGIFDPGYDGVDLNRNYGFNWEYGGSNDPSSEYYKGPAPFSESETQVIRDLAQRERFLMAIDFHSARTGQGEVIYYPWRWGANFCIDYPFIRSIADSLAESILNDAGTGCYTAIYGVATEGNFRNWLYATLGTYAYTVEISWGCTPPGYRVDDICQRVLDGLNVFMQRATGPGVTIYVVDSISLLPLEAEVRVQNYYDPSLPPRTSDPVFGVFRKLLTPGVYSFEIMKDGYETTFVGNVNVVDTPVSVIVKMKPQSGVTEERHGRLMQVIPDYSSGVINFVAKVNESGNCTLQVFDSSGRLVTDVTRVSFADDRYVWHVPKNFSNGVYFAVFSKSGRTTCKRFLWLRSP